MAWGLTGCGRGGRFVGPREVGAGHGNAWCVMYWGQTHLLVWLTALLSAVTVSACSSPRVEHQLSVWRDLYGVVVLL